MWAWCANDNTGSALDHRQNLKWGILKDCLQYKFWSPRNVKSQNTAIENTSTSIVDLKCKKEDHLVPITCGSGGFTMTSIFTSFTLFKINISKMFCSTWKKMFKIIWKSPRHCLCVWISNSIQQMWRACVYTHAAISCGLNQTTELASPPPPVFPRPVLGSETPCKVWFSIFGPGYLSATTFSA